jgi:glyoxylase-like metal-dependent hydrolase (beta-lactamase superfamily II)
MSKDTYCFKIGNLECLAISDGTLTYTPPIFPPPATALFANAPREQLEQVLLGYDIRLEEWIEWTSTYTCLIVKTSDYIVLVDTGAGNRAPSTGKLQQNMKTEGLIPEDIDVVIITHAHPDHIGGNTIREGKPAFPNARYVMWKDEWDFWTSERAERELDEHMAVPLSIARKKLPSIQGQLELIDRETEIVPGICALAAPGHTPGHMALAISSIDDKLLVLSDTVLHPIHLERPEWHAVFDIDPQQTVSTRRRLLHKAMVERYLVLAFHFPFPGLGYVLQKGEGWQWQPIETTS